MAHRYSDFFDLQGNDLGMARYEAEIRIFHAGSCLHYSSILTKRQLTFN
jgi:hypothetical protein